jgi:hypothetical protein
VSISVPPPLARQAGVGSLAGCSAFFMPTRYEKIFSTESMTQPVAPMWKSQLAVCFECVSAEESGKLRSV